MTAIIPFYEEHGIRCNACSPIAEPNIAATPSGTNTSCIAHMRTKVKTPQTNGIVDRFHKTMLDEFYRIAFRKKVYATIDKLQRDLDAWMRKFNELRPRQGKWCSGKWPMQTFIDALPLACENSDRIQAIEENAAA